MIIMIVIIVILTIIVLNEWIWRNIWFMGKAKLGTPKITQDHAGPQFVNAVCWWFK